MPTLAIESYARQAKNVEAEAKFGKIPEQDFEQTFAKPGKPSTTGIIREHWVPSILGRGAAQPPFNERGLRDPGMFVLDRTGLLR